MLFNSRLTTAEVSAVFAESIATHGGSVSDTFDDGWRLFVRAILSRVEEVRPGDRLQGGVALKATAEGLWLYPYVFRQICRNGAIMAETLEARSVGQLPAGEPAAVLQTIREGVAACCDREVFAETVDKMRVACRTDADLILNLMPLVSRLSPGAGGRMLSEIMDRFLGEGDRSAFGLANAVTSVARDTQDPDTRWDLEELGGGIASGLTPKQPADHGGAVVERARALASVG